ncbi:YeeE/YedE family protein [Mesorhizobium sp. CGMCC 1.15528]|uniref:YeeE/YedE family protein n=1 Tax=Mesorhizobium zhangyense TaxID=1776730 RepID=A0A7C9R8A0_9HYPH|nr:DUF6691 family protein [Mesorhizobium zhangyense]NGN42276.1 YeeE/YedE family protein [Mesorhizobium zhangyense]
MTFVVNLLLGLLFGIGLVVSGMSNPPKVLNFLDLAGTWNPSLLFVMIGAVLVTFLGYRIVLRRDRPLLANAFRLPTAKDVDARLLSGAAIFGIGWGLGGFCPGPALTALGFAAPGALVFVPAMFAGLWAARMLTLARPPLKQA